MDLNERAKKLGIDVSKYEDNEDGLKTAIEEAEKKDNNLTVEDLKKELEYQKTEAKKAFEARDRAKEDREKFRSEMKKLEEKMKEIPSGDELEELRKANKELSKWKKEHDEAKEKEEIEKMDELKRKDFEHEKHMKELNESFDQKMKDLTGKIEALQTKHEEDQTQIVALRKIRLEKDLLHAITNNKDNKAFKPTQVVKLTINDFEYDEKLDDWRHLVRDEKGKLVGEKTISEYVSDFLANEENSNLVESKMNTNSFQSQKMDGDKDKKASKNIDGFDPNDPAIKEEAEVRGLKPEAWINILKKKNEKLSKIKENSK